MLKSAFFATVLFLYTANLLVFAQVNPQDKNQAIDSIIKQLNERYIFPDIAKKMEQHLKKLQKQKKYDKLSDGEAFANQLTADIRSVYPDKHLTVFYSKDELVPNGDADLMSMPDSLSKLEAVRLKNRNYGIRSVEVLKGNIGYLDFEFFCSPAFAGNTYAAMMNYIAHTDALIIDLRYCAGSMSADAIPFICSYFFEKPVHLIDLNWRKGNINNQYWTYAQVPGTRYLQKPIYVLTSGGTFSGAEEMAYDLQNLKRATIIGQVTGGGANGGGVINVTNHFSIFIPLGQAISPITKTNWEGVGVKPDILINSKLALHKAQELILENQINNTSEPEWKNQLISIKDEVEQTKPVFKQIDFHLQGFDTAKEVYVAGTFNDWSDKSARMTKKGNQWYVTVEAEKGPVAYKFVVDGNWMLDPGNPKTISEGGNTNSATEVP
jgi:hypothetical protein